jgi:hypothetical protein
MRKQSSFVPAALAAAVSLVVASASLAAGPSARLAPTPQGPVGPVEGFEDQSLAIPLALKPGQLSLLTAPANGNVVLSGDPARYLPNANFSGDDSFTVRDHKGNTQAFNVRIRPVNDAPRFTAGNDLGHLAATRGEFTVPGWATGISVGPADEQLTQALQFEVSEPAETSEVIRDAWVDADGTLHYVLTGAAGIGTRLVQAVDSGGGDNASKQHLLRIGVGLETDLSIKRGAAFWDEISPWARYQLIVTNNGPRAVTAAQVAEVFESGGEQYLWSCAGFDGGRCSVEAGEGPVDTLVSLKVGGVVVFDVRSRDPLTPPGKRVSFVVPDATMVDINPANNALED